MERLVEQDSYSLHNPSCARLELAAESYPNKNQSCGNLRNAKSLCHPLLKLGPIPKCIQLESQVHSTHHLLRQSYWKSLHTHATH